MTKSTSVFLNLLRGIAALTVFYWHLTLYWKRPCPLLAGHAAVIVFFVLSGYVIAYYVFRRPGLTLREYVTARLARLCSVTVPALLLTAFLLLLGCLLMPGIYQHLHRDHDPLRFLATNFFLQEAWGVNFSPPTNGPFWSLGYEFWYYAMFAGLVFARGWKWKTISVLTCCLIVGFNVLLLLPVWALGAAAYLYAPRLRLAQTSARIGFGASLLLTMALAIWLPPFPREVGDAPFFYSGSFVSDWLLGAAVSGLIGFFVPAWGDLTVPSLLEAPIAWFADHTFSLYLFHLPLVFFANALGIFNPKLGWSAALEAALILSVVLALSEITEARRKLWQHGFDRAWGRLAARG